MKNRLTEKGAAPLLVVGLIVAVLVVGGVVAYALQARKSDSSSNATTTGVATETEDEDDTAKDEASAKQEAKAHFTLVYAKRADEAYDKTCQEFKDNTTRQEFKDGLESGGFYTIDLSGVDYTTADVGNNQASLEGAVGPLQPNTNIQVKLLKKNGSWCILGYQTT